MTFDQAVDMCRDLDIPEDEIDAVIDSAELCNCGDEGPCQENSETIIHAAAKRFDETGMKLRRDYEDAKESFSNGLATEDEVLAAKKAEDDFYEARQTGPYMDRSRPIADAKTTAVFASLCISLFIMFVGLAIYGGMR